VRVWVVGGTSIGINLVAGGCPMLIKGQRRSGGSNATRGATADGDRLCSQGGGLL